MPLFLSFAGAALQIAAVWHLAQKRLTTLFPCLAFHLAANALWIIVSVPLTQGSATQRLIWKTGAVITICSLIALFLETVSRSLEHFPGLSTRAVLAAFGVIAAISTVLGAFEPASGSVRTLLMVQRVSGLAVALAAVALLVLLNYFDSRRRTNVIRHERITAAMAAATAFAAWLSNHGYPQLGAIILGIGSILFPALWIWALQPEGEIDLRPLSDISGLATARAARSRLRKFYED